MWRIAAIIVAWYVFGVVVATVVALALDFAERQDIANRVWRKE